MGTSCRTHHRRWRFTRRCIRQRPDFRFHVELVLLLWLLRLLYTELVLLLPELVLLLLLLLLLLVTVG